MVQEAETKNNKVKKRLDEMVLYPEDPEETRRELTKEIVCCLRRESTKWEQKKKGRKQEHN